MVTDLINEYGVTVGAAKVSVLLNSQARRAVILSNGGATTITVSASPNLTAGTGLVLPPNTQPLRICREEFAPWICGALYAIGSGAGGVLGIVEIVDQN